MKGDLFKVSYTAPCLYFLIFFSNPPPFSSPVCQITHRCFRSQGLIALNICDFNTDQNNRDYDVVHHGAALSESDDGVVDQMDS